MYMPTSRIPIEPKEEMATRVHVEVKVSGSVGILENIFGKAMLMRTELTVRERGLRLVQ